MALPNGKLCHVFTQPRKRRTECRRIWLDFDGFEWIWMDLSGFGRIGRICLDLNGFGWLSAEVLMDLARFWADVAGLIGFG